MKSPKVGERVAVYTTADAPPFKGVIIRAEQASLKVKFEEGQFGESPTRPSDGPYHPKQCRRLVPVKRERIWVLCEQGEIGSTYPNGVSTIQPAPEKERVRGLKRVWKEFVAVREKK